jgi:predicted lipid-binding transport protein (Tim44 family)
MSDSVFTETEMARAYREIGMRDPAFDMPAFLRQIKADVPTIIRAYLEGEIDVLKVLVTASVGAVRIHPFPTCMGPAMGNAEHRPRCSCWV